MKGALWSVAPDARIVDLTHDIPPQGLREAGLFLREVIGCYPPQTIHVVVVDPGVGTDRAALLIEWNSQRILAPDNGCWWPAISNEAPSLQVYRLDRPEYWRQPLSDTFHGRDLFAPVAGHLGLGVQPDRLGKIITTWSRLDLPKPIILVDSIVGEILTVDRFGNLISNISRADLAKIEFQSIDVAVGGIRVGPLTRTYGDRPAGTLIALFSSSGFVEIAVVNGSASSHLQLGVGATVEVRPALVSVSPNATTT
jgi:S-adenosylmethionine hydrolase